MPRNTTLTSREDGPDHGPTEHLKSQDKVHRAIVVGKIAALSDECRRRGMLSTMVALDAVWETLQAGQAGALASFIETEFFTTKTKGGE